ncbi:hypothetical protein PXK30_03600 [Phaeobacter gallaeciensis]|uniref:hypothetical protein n=1 Tax=Phaeobacter gallaeciensis TaxID=60890 RepID=UPI00237F28D0|nr:hypothetical protein [Phaeobacter gallaeciensis]MDE4303993.1 hypothetical protein [Phaeobacter gallaeciensis]MDE4309053.1 hypothetical protein [Phaeobacter gallaeciensis]MDE4313393.1 hypothetical protein [Phaeobacter gallaeciensis]MDE4317982.1 hypothetical protein [Phaeobacter gallaeciensis]MDE4322445.1 hypothetical protein [Phaeobacter gallaeciensis]
MQDITKTARQIAGSPEDHLDEIHLFTSAWAAMKAARGQGFNPSRLRAAHLIDSPAPSPEPTQQTLDRVAQKAREIIDAKGYQPKRRHVA